MQWEAQAYRTVAADVWRDVPKLAHIGVPVLAVGGMGTNTFTAASIRKFRRLVPDATVAEIAGHGHLFPQTAPDEARRLLLEWLEEQGVG